MAGYSGPAATTPKKTAAPKASTTTTPASTPYADAAASYGDDHPFGMILKAADNIMARTGNKPMESAKGGELTPLLPPQPAQTPQQQVQSLISPLAMQLMFSKTIGPMLQQVANQSRQDASQYGQVMSQMENIPGLPAEYKSVLQASVPQMQAAMNLNTNAQEGAALTSPGIDALMQQIQQAQALQKLAQYEQERAIAYGVSGNPLAALTAGLPVVGGTAATGATTPASTGQATSALTALQQQQLAGLGISTPTG